MELPDGVVMFAQHGTPNGSTLAGRSWEDWGKAAFEPMVAAAEGLRRLMVELWGPVIERTWADVAALVAQLDPAALLTAEQREAAFRDYAARLNGGRRRWRKVRWTRLSAGERQRAALAWLERERAEAGEGGFGRFMAVGDALLSRKQGAFARKRGR